MSSHVWRFEDAVLEDVLPKLEAEGFSVVPHPSHDMLPPFFNNHLPDAIAYKGSKKVVVEVVTGATPSGPKLEDMRRALQGHPDWELHVVYAPRASVGNDIPASSRELVQERLEEALSLSVGGGASTAAALLLAWAAFEAAARLQLPTSLARPQSPSSLTEALASGGYVTPTEANRLRDLGRLRNQIAHGRLDLTATPEQITDLVAMTRSVAELNS